MTDEECERIKPPFGWKFQDCEDDLVSLIKISNINWKPDFRSDNTVIRDAYIRCVDESGEWKVYIGEPSLPVAGKKQGNIRESKEKAVKEAVCLAEYHDTWEKRFEKGSNIQFKQLDRVALETLAECRSRMGISKR